MTTVINDWAKILDNRGQVDTFILDFEKAFDTPTHEHVCLSVCERACMSVRYMRACVRACLYLCLSVCVCASV